LLYITRKRIDTKRIDLLSQFLSPKTNRRTDAYSPPLAILHQLVKRIRDVTPSKFVLGIKLSSTDFVAAGSVTDEEAQKLAEARALEHVKDIANWGMVDFLEISGGDYENPGMSSPLSHILHTTDNWKTL
jgi:2,4-dienoyl-CoA reductase-like NADH-dependent reductase (Old Yellow Enzyme family)